ncbi:MAG: hypothetical protein GF419_01125 [Ignavibacteriales bacterium]|nr:hypothetical protein [Ignavibacteriales bacterium]
MTGPTTVERDRLLLLGVDFFGDPFRKSDEWTEENEIGELWKRFMPFAIERRNELRLADERGLYEVHLYGEETPHKGFFEVFVGASVETVEEAPINLVAKVLPAARYAVFTLNGEEIVSDWDREIFRERLPAAGFKQAAPFGFQYYDARFKGMDKIAESALDVYVPIALRG